mmetsp:Transcript_45542/g.142643  ORF Transcript_45542/g.142643 Transcript_45542/m.142643 type:complete len:389 (+) Transcript_45542:157-1323(+)
MRPFLGPPSPAFGFRRRGARRGAGFYPGAAKTLFAFSPILPPAASLAPAFLAFRARRAASSSWRRASLCASRCAFIAAACCWRCSAWRCRRDSRFSRSLAMVLLSMPASTLMVTLSLEPLSEKPSKCCAPASVEAPLPCAASKRISRHGASDRLATAPGRMRMVFENFQCRLLAPLCLLMTASSSERRSDESRRSSWMSQDAKPTASWQTSDGVYSPRSGRLGSDPLRPSELKMPPVTRQWWRRVSTPKGAFVTGHTETSWSGTQWSRSGAGRRSTGATRSMMKGSAKRETAATRRSVSSTRRRSRRSGPPPGPSSPAASRRSMMYSATLVTNTNLAAGAIGRPRSWPAEAAIHCVHESSKAITSGSPSTSGAFGRISGLRLSTALPL